MAQIKRTKKTNAFTLVEILIVVVILAVLAAIVIPQAGKATNAAKDSALAHDLQMLRRYILIYKGQHLEVPPGYPNGDKTQTPVEQAFIDQLTMASNSKGQTAAKGTPGYGYGPYLMKIPKNHFCEKSTVQMLDNGQNFPAEADGSHGWIYKAATSEIRADNTGTDENGTVYYDY